MTQQVIGKVLLTGLAGTLCMSGFACSFEGTSAGPETSPPAVTREYPNALSAVAGHRVLSSHQAGTKAGLACDRPNAIVQDQTGRYWISGPLGLSVYDESLDRWSRCRWRDRLDLDFQDAPIARGGDGKLWVLQWGSLSFIERMKVTDVDVPSVSDAFQRVFPGYPKDSPTLTDLNRFHTMFEGKDGTIWFVRHDELMAHDGRMWSVRMRPSEHIERAYAGQTLRSFGERRQLASETRARTLSMSSDLLQMSKRRPATALSETYCGLENRQREIWLGADRGLLVFRHASSEWKLYPLPERLVQVALLYEDRGGRIWTADRYGSVAVRDPATDSWTAYLLRDLFPEVRTFGVRMPKNPISPSREERNDPIVSRPTYVSSRVAAIYQDKAGKMMFATPRGLIVFSEPENKWEIFTPENSGLLGQSVTTIAADHSERIWVGTAGGIVVLEQ